MHGYLSKARCRFAYGPADPIATHCLLLQEIQIGFGFTFLVPAHTVPDKIQRADRMAYGQQKSCCKIKTELQKLQNMK